MAVSYSHSSIPAYTLTCWLVPAQIVTHKVFLHWPSYELGKNSFMPSACELFHYGCSAATSRPAFKVMTWSQTLALQRLILLNKGVYSQLSLLFFFLRSWEPLWAVDLMHFGRGYGIGLLRTFRQLKWILMTRLIVI